MGVRRVLGCSDPVPGAGGLGTMKEGEAEGESPDHGPHLSPRGGQGVDRRKETVGGGR